MKCEQPETNDLNRQNYTVLLVNVFLVSFSMMLFQMTSFQVVFHMTNYILAVYSISIALMGLIAGGVLAFIFSKSLLNRYRSLWVFPVFLSLFMGISILDIMFLHTIDSFSFFVSMFVVFFISGIFISHSFALYDSFYVYAANMIGSGLGVMATVLFVPFVLEENTLLICMALPLAGAVVFLNLPRPARRLKITGCLLFILTLLAVTVINHGTRYFNFVRDSLPNAYSHPASMNKLNVQWLLTRGGVCGRIDLGKAVFEKKNKPNVEPEVHDPNSIKEIMTFINNRHLDGINRLTAEESFPDVRLPSALYEETVPRILLIGSAAEGITKSARMLGKNDVTAVEINPAVIRIMTEDYTEFSRNPYEDLDLHLTDIRTFLKHSSEQFDIITLLNTHNFYIGFDPIPDYPFTEEAIKDYFSHLSDDGIIDMEELSLAGKTDNAVSRQLFNFFRVMKREKIAEDPFQHLYVYTWRRSNFADDQWFYQIVIKKTPFGKDEIEKLNQWVMDFNSKELATDILYPALPGKSDPNIVTRLLANPPEPITDNDPFNLNDNMKSTQRVLTMMVYILTIIGAGILVLPSRDYIRSAKKFAWNWLFIVFFMFSGFSYMFFEIYMFQKNQMYVGTIGMSLVVSTAIMLIMSGIGSLVASKMTPRQQLVLMGCIPVYILAWAWFSDSLFAGHTLWFKSSLLRAVTVFIMLGPLCFLMGIPFAVGMNLVKKRFGNVYANYMFAVNGIAASLGTILSLNLTIKYGFEVILFISILLYLSIFSIAFVVFRQEQDRVYA